MFEAPFTFDVDWFWFNTTGVVIFDYHFYNKGDDMGRQYYYIEVLPESYSIYNVGVIDLLRSNVVVAQTLTGTDYIGNAYPDITPPTGTTVNRMELFIALDMNDYLSQIDAFNRTRLRVELSSDSVNASYIVVSTDIITVWGSYISYYATYSKVIDYRMTEGEDVTVNVTIERLVGSSWSSEFNYQYVWHVGGISTMDSSFNLMSLAFGICGAIGLLFSLAMAGWMFRTGKDSVTIIASLLACMLLFGVITYVFLLGGT
jgi:hypothetical protein